MKRFNMEIYTGSPKVNLSCFREFGELERCLRYSDLNTFMVCACLNTCWQTVPNKWRSSSKSTRSPAACCFSNDVSVWVAPAFIKSNSKKRTRTKISVWGNPDRNVVAKTTCCWSTCGFAWWLWFPRKNHHWKRRSVSEWEHAWPRGGTEWSKRIAASPALLTMCWDCMKNLFIVWGENYDAYCIRKW